MKSGKFSIELIKIMVNNLIKKRRKTYPPHIFNERINIPYLNDKNQYHTYDVYLANKENRKNICVIDIHGGAYIFGKHQDNYPYAYEFLNAGFDVVLLDYVPNNGKRDISDIVSDCVNNLKHLFQNLEEYGLEEDVFFMAGDSAGGHLALLLSEAIRRKEVASILNIELPDFALKGVVVNSPAYDFENLGEGVLSKSGFK